MKTCTPAKRLRKQIQTQIRRNPKHTPHLEKRDLVDDIHPHFVVRWSHNLFSQNRTRGRFQGLEVVWAWRKRRTKTHRWIFMQARTACPRGFNHGTSKTHLKEPNTKKGGIYIWGCILEAVSLLSSHLIMFEGCVLWFAVGFGVRVRARELIWFD